MLESTVVLTRLLISLLCAATLGLLAASCSGDGGRTAEKVLWRHPLPGEVRSTDRSD